MERYIALDVFLFLVFVAILAGVIILLYSFYVDMHKKRKEKGGELK